VASAYPQVESALGGRHVLARDCNVVLRRVPSPYPKPSPPRADSALGTARVQGVERRPKSQRPNPSSPNPPQAGDSA